INHFTPTEMSVPHAQTKGSVLIWISWLALVCVCAISLIANRHFSSPIDSLARIECAARKTSWIGVGEYVHALGLVVNGCVQGRLIVETNKQFKSETRQLFIPILKLAVFNRSIYDFFPNEHRVIVNDDLAREYQFAVIKHAVYRFSQKSGNTLLDFNRIVDTSDNWLNPKMQMLGDRMSDIPYLVTKENNRFSRIFEREIRCGDYRIQTNPRSISEVQLPLRKIGLLNGLLRQRFCVFPRFFGVSELFIHRISLAFNAKEGKPRNECVNYRDIYDDPFRALESWQRFLCGLILTIGGFGLAAHGGQRWVDNNMRWWDWLLILSGIGTCCMGGGLLVFGHAWRPKQECSQYSNRQLSPHNTESVMRSLLNVC